MNSKLLVALLALSFCVAVASAQMLGGLHDEKPADDEVRKVVSSVHSQLEDAAQQKYVSVEPISYRKQIVAGANYFIKAIVTAKDGTKSHIHMRVYKPFRGPLELSAVKTNQDKSKPLEYFQ